MFCGCRLELIRHQYVHHELLDFLLFDELRGLIVLELDDNVITNLGLRWELQKVTHEIRDLTLIEEAAAIDINDTECVSDLLAVEVFLALSLD